MCRGLGYNIISERLLEKENHPHQGRGGGGGCWILNGMVPPPEHNTFSKNYIFW